MEGGVVERDSEGEGEGGVERERGREGRWKKRDEGRRKEGGTCMRLINSLCFVGDFIPNTLPPPPPPLPLPSTNCTGNTWTAWTTW